MSPLEHDLVALIHKHATVTGPEFVETAMRVAEGYFDDLPLFDADALLDELRRELAA